MHKMQFERLMRETAEQYRQPATTPRDEIWSRLQHARAARRIHQPRRTVVRPLVWVTGIAAALMIGIGLGRLSVLGRLSLAPQAVSSKPTAVGTTNERTTVPTAYRITTMEHLGQAEVFLTLFRLSVQRGVKDPLASATARHLLATNRLLLDSPAGVDRSTRALLEDLELVLAMIAQLSPESRVKDFKLVTSGMARADFMARLRSEVPAGTGYIAPPGAL